MGKRCNSGDFCKALFIYHDDRVKNLISTVRFYYVACIRVPFNIFAMFRVYGCAIISLIDLLIAI